jgi:hypothetical protein
MNSMLFNAGGVDILTLCDRRAIAVSSNYAGGLRARAKSIPDCANTGVALQINHGSSNHNEP